MIRSNDYKDFSFFYRTKSPFSNWHPCKFKDPAGVEYNCSEQYMMAQKALLFDDEEIYDKIMATSDQKLQKELGRQIKNFVKEDWEDSAMEFVYAGCFYKFTQNPKLLAELLATEGTLLVEAAENDKI